jgi:hypothetical protein
MFSRNTILKLVESLNFEYHAEVDRFALQFGLEDLISGSTIKGKGTSLMRHLIKNPEATAPDGELLSLAIIGYLLSKCGERSIPSERFPELVNSLDRDGYVLDKNGVRPRLPQEIPISVQENELIELLDRFGYSVARGHYEQAVSAHTRGNWAAANSQLRSFVEEFFDRVTDVVAPGSYASGHNRREALARAGYFQADLNEWSNDGKGFVQGFWKRLHPQGSHPGLSEKEDSTFRLHLVIVVMHYFAKRIEHF